MLNIQVNAKKSTAKEVKATTTVVSNDIMFVGHTEETFTIYTKEGKGKLKNQLSLYICPKPVGVRPSAKSVFNGDWEVVYEKGQGKTADQIKTINDAVSSKYITSLSKGEGLVLSFPVEKDIEVMDIVNNDKVRAMIEYCAANLAKPKTFLIKVVTINKTKAVFFTSKYVGPTTSPTICSSVAEAFGK